MRAKDIKTNETYRVKNNPYYFKPIEVLKPKEKENTNSYIVVKGKFSTDKNNFDFALIKYFKPVDIYSL